MRLFLSVSAVGAISFAVRLASAQIPLIPTLAPPPAPVATPPVPAEASPPTTALAIPLPPRDWLALLGGLERASVQRALAARGLTIEPSPWGKTIERVHIVNEDVFAEKNRVLGFFNNFHITTRESVIAKELVIGAGELWDQDRIDETQRRLRDPLWTSVVAVVPVVAKSAGMVDMLVVTRDVWSLRFNTKYSFSADQQGQKLTNLSVSLSENNFLGRRAVLAAAMVMDQSEVSLGPLFIDKNLAGKHLDFRARANAIYNRDALVQRHAFEREGSDSSISLNRTLWSLASTWAAGGSFSHDFHVERSFRGTELRTYDNPDTPEPEAFPFVYDYKVISGSAYVTRQWGKRIKQQLSFGYSAARVEAEPYRFEGDATQRAAFIRDVLPRSEVTSGPYVEYAGYEPIYRTLRNLQTYDLGEDARFGFDYAVLLGGGATFLGADRNAVRASASAGYTVRWCRDGYVRASGAVGVRRQPGVDPEHTFIDNTASASLRIATPSNWLGRIVVSNTLATRWNDTQNRFYTIGSENGLRGFVIDEFLGDRVYNTQAEARSKPYALWVFRVGGVAFYEVGGAADALKHIALHHDIGMGFRLLVPQTSRELFRFDLAMPLDGPHAGTPRFIAGFESAF